LLKSYSKVTTYAKSSGNIVAVFAPRTGCGSYTKLDIFMDCEDNNPSSYIQSIGDGNFVYNVGSFGGGGNITMSFCEIPQNCFRAYNVDYAILNLTGYQINEVDRIIRYFDNEDHANQNSVTEANQSFGKTWHQGDNFIDDNSRLDFLYYKADNSQPLNFPNLGINYYVLGSFGTERGTIYTDDEDDSNSDGCAYYQWNGAGWDNIDVQHSVSPSPDSYFPDIMTLTGGISGTNLYLSKAYSALPTYTITGYVKNADGTPYGTNGGCQVLLYNSLGISLYSYIDSQGKYTFTGVPYGFNGYVKPINSGFVPGQISISNLSQDISNEVFVMSTYVIGGQVLNSASYTPISGVKVSVVNSNPEVFAYTNSNGMYSIPYYSNITVQVKASKTGYNFIPAVSAQLYMNQNQTANFYTRDKVLPPQN
jgi:hypothetical protein